MIRSLAAVLLAALASTALAQNPPVRVRGTVEKLDNSILAVKSRDGSTVNIKLADNFAVAGVAKASLSDVTAGKFVGIATLGERDGALVALEVLIFPDNMRGAGEGHYAWDLKPGSMMTNANVEGLVGTANERMLTLRYKGGDKKVVVPESTPIVTFVPAERSELKSGAHVFLTAQRQPDGSLAAGRVNVGMNGLVPPM